MSEDLDLLTNFMKSEKSGVCPVCNQPTNWIEINFESYLHPGACADKMWADYWDACANSSGNGDKE